jgi:sterol desaturase/sphingolipid hydroxylase (fatty acid hydroxylase superfamily)
MRTRPLPPWIIGVAGTAIILVLTWRERRKPLRRLVEPKLRHTARNLTVAGVSAIALGVAERPVVMPLAALAERRNWGLLRRFAFPPWVEVTIALVLMDYTFYVWHILMHRVPLLWRFHLVHHVDLDLDASTALRFHFAEMLASIPWRAGQVTLIGLTPFTFSVWQCVFLFSILFHHSNVELPIRWERRLNRLVVTPRMHGIHHSIVEKETDSNWSSGLTIWDWIHGTLRLNVPQSKITIGVPAFQELQSITLPRVLAMPFEDLPSNWQFPAGGSPKPHPAEAAATVLLP